MQTLAAWLQVVTSAIIVIRWFFSPRGKRFRKKVARIIRFAIDTFRESSDDGDDDDDTRTWCDGRPLFSIPSLIDLGLFSGYQLGSRAFSSSFLHNNPESRSKVQNETNIFYNLNIDSFI